MDGVREGPGVQVLCVHRLSSTLLASTISPLTPASWGPGTSQGSTGKFFLIFLVFLSAGVQVVKGLTLINPLSLLQLLLFNSFMEV